MKLTASKLNAIGLTGAEAQEIVEQVNHLLQTEADVSCWQKVTTDILKPHHPFELHLFLYHHIYSQRDPLTDPGPAWIPKEQECQTTHIATALKECDLQDYAALHRWSTENREEFWQYAIKKLGIVFSKPASAIVNLNKGVEYPQWLPDAKFNIVDSCLQADKKKIAIISQEDKQYKKLTYGELEQLVNRIANSIVAQGYQPGTALAIDMPMHATAVAIYLAIIKAGCVVVSVADSFAADEIATRLRIADAKATFTQFEIKRNHKTLPLYSKVKEAADTPAIVLACDEQQAKTLRAQDITWQDFLGDENEFTSVACSAETAATILFSSGTTGVPKAIPWTHSTAIKAATDAHFHQDTQAHDVWAWPTNLGWMMGPWLVYAALLNRSTLALSDEVPTGRAFGEFVQEAKVSILGLVPSLVNTWRTTACMEGLNWQSLKAFSSSGECSNAEDMLYLMSLAGYKPIIEYCGGTEIGGAYITSTMVQPNIPATFSTPTLGLDFILLDEHGQESNIGEVALIPPSMGLSNTLLNKDHHQVYYQDMPRSAKGEVLRRHGDQLEKISHHYYRALGRVDDTMNIGAIKVSSVEIERSLVDHPAVSETAAVAINPPNGGPSRLVIFAVPQPDNELTPEQLKQQFQQLIKTNLNPLFKIYQVVCVDALPRTASNKIMRRVLRDGYELK